MPLEPTLFGENLQTGATKEEARKIMEKYPATKEEHQVGLFYYEFLVGRVLALPQLPETVRNELRDACRSLESIRRRRQKILEDDRAAQKGGTENHAEYTTEL